MSCVVFSVFGVLACAVIAYATWPLAVQWVAAALFVLGIVASVRAHREPAIDEVHL